MSRYIGLNRTADSGFTNRILSANCLTAEFAKLPARLFAIVRQIQI